MLTTRLLKRNGTFDGHKYSKTVNSGFQGQITYIQRGLTNTILTNLANENQIMRFRENLIKFSPKLVCARGAKMMEANAANAAG